MKGEGLLMLLGKAKPGPSEKSSDGDSYDADLGDAFDEFAAAVKSGDRKAGIEAFKAMSMLCDQGGDD